MSRQRFVLIALLLALALVAAPASAKKKSRPEESLSEGHRTWLETVELLFEAGERDAFLELSTDDERDAFIAEFWRRRDPHPETDRNELRQEWTYRATLARRHFEDLSDPRARFVLENGWPDERYPVRCPGVRAHEVWLYRADAERRQDVPVILYPMAWEWRVWDPWDSERMFYGKNGRPRKPPEDCNYEAFQGAVYRIQELNEPRGSYAELVARFTETSLRRLAEKRYVADPTALPEGAGAFDARLAVTFSGRHQSRTVLDALVAVPRAAVDPVDLRGVRSYNFDLFGKVLRHGVVFETFRYRFDMPEREVAGDTLPLAFQRKLRPGDYEIVVRVEDLASGRSYYERREIEVPAAGEPSASEAARGAAPAARPPAAAAVPDARLEIVEEPSELRTDLVRFRLRSASPAVDRVAFALDDKPIFTKRRPPYSVELDLGDLPSTRLLRATAFDAGGRVIASDSLLVNPNPHDFAVRLVEPVHGRPYRGRVEARAEAAVPEGRRLERVEIYRDNICLGTFERPPFRHPIELPAAPRTTLVRAVGYLDDGSTAEDVVIVNSPDPGDEITVDLVELYVTVADRDRRPVEGLAASDFTVFENGRRQQVRRFEAARDLPVHATLMIDLSASMAERLGTAREAALDFFEQTIGERDSLALVTFSDRPAVAVAPTHDFALFAEGLAGLRAEGGTALYDSLVFALFHGESLKGQRAVLVLSDGLDEGSRHTFEEALEAARRAGVAVYPIGLDLPRRGRRTLERFSAETGGRAFFVDDVTELDEVYATIRNELSARYLLAYQSAGDVSESGGFRSVEVVVGRRGLETKTIRGYYP